MKILSIMTITAATAEPPTQEKMNEMQDFMAEARGKGVLLDTGGRDPNMLELIVSRKGAKTTTTDGPFTESKEFVGGYALLEVKDRDDAIAWTNRFLDIVGDATCHIHEVGDTP